MGDARVELGSTGPWAMGVAGMAGQKCGTARLTPRETQVVRLVARGLTTGQIARRLCLSRRTVDNHVQRAMARTGCPSRAALVGWAIRRELA